MFAKSGGWDGYLSVGRSSVNLILEALVLADLQEVRTVLDFGCGHGRTARHLPLLFRDAALLFSDIDESAWKFCASQFPNAHGFPSHEDFGQVTLPENIDVIFVGSVFTHLDWDRCRILWSTLFDALAPDGVLIPTFRGAKCYRMMIADPERHNFRGYYDAMINDYLATGFGYQDYKGFKAWGQHLASIGRVTELASGRAHARLIGYKETGWAGVHDVGVWTKKATPRG
jgi:trans-aconitate methyltransferase